MLSKRKTCMQLTRSQCASAARFFSDCSLRSLPLAVKYAEISAGDPIIALYCPAGLYTDGSRKISVSHSHSNRSCPSLFPIVDGQEGVQNAISALLAHLRLYCSDVEGKRRARRGGTSKPSIPIKWSLVSGALAAALDVVM